MVAAPGVRPAHLLRRVGRLVLRPWRRGWRRTIKDVAWELDQIRVRRRLWRTSAGQRDLLRRELMRDEPRRRAECVFTLTLGSRRIAHRDNQLERFLRSFLAMTERPERAEILVKVDDDDDLEFFLRVKRRYARDVDLRFLVGERGRGYADLHKYQAALLALRNPASRICILLSEDAEFVLPKWDTEFLSRWDKLPHDCFIGADCPFEEAIAILGPYS
ncbi:MAG: hypothetical protein HY660_18130, partial [Armatimonadetes bacterium]|nr:hypothetical protein [Armatimonadota bacterium]